MVKQSCLPSTCLPDWIQANFEFQHLHFLGIFGFHRGNTLDALLAFAMWKTILIGSSKSYCNVKILALKKARNWEISICYQIQVEEQLTTSWIYRTIVFKVGYILYLESGNLFIKRGQLAKGWTQRGGTLACVYRLLAVWKRASVPEPLSWHAPEEPGCVVLWWSLAAIGYSAGGGRCAGPTGGAACAAALI